MNNLKVGVNLDFTSNSPRRVPPVGTGVCGILVNAIKGPLNKATLVTSLTEYEGTFGSVSPSGCTSHEQVAAFFADPQSAYLYVVRVASSTAAKATKTFVDRQGAPANTLQINAKSDGSWGLGISVVIENHNILSTTPTTNITASTDTDATLTSTSGLEIGSDIKISEGGNTEYRRLINVDHAAKKVYWTTGLTNSYTAAGATVVSMEFTLKVYYQGVLVETHEGLSMNDSVSFFIEKKITDATSDYIAAVDLKTSDTDYQDLPATATATALLSGADGLADVVEADYVGVKADKTGVYALDEVPGLFRFCVPNPILTDVDPAAAYILLVQAMINYEYKRKTVEFIGDTPYGFSISQTISFAGNFVDRNIWLYHPWGTHDSENETWLAPSSAVMGTAVDKDRRRGVYKSKGNERVSYFIKLKYNSDPEEGELLNDAGINMLRVETGRGVITWGDRTLSAELKFRDGAASEYANYIGIGLFNRMQSYAFEPNSPDTWQRMLQSASLLFEEEKQKGAISGYELQMDSDNNPNAQTEEGIAVIAAKYWKYPTAEKILIQVDPQSGLVGIS